MEDDKEEYSIKLLLEHVKVDARQTRFTKQFLDPDLEEKYREHIK